MSPVIEQITGFSAQEIDAMSSNELLDRIHPDDSPLVIVRIAQALDKGFGTHEYRFKCKDGKYRWFADHFTVTKDKNGMPAFRAGIVRDITESKKAEENLEEKVKERTAELEEAYNSLKESEKGLAEAQKMAHIGNWEWDIATDKVILV